ncbi:MAG: Glyceraldehyde-3-phosphate dehydrogenase [Bacteroidota bacterium]
MRDNEKVRVGIHGFGRIGRGVFRAALGFENIEIVAVVDLHDVSTMFHLLRYDSIHGSLKGQITGQSSGWKSNGIDTHYHQKSSGSEVVDWSQWGVDVVIESTGIWKTQSELSQHLSQGVKKVILSAPSDDDAIPMVVLGINDEGIEQSNIISCASCTTNSAAHMIQLIDENCQIESCSITTVHSYTGDQRLHDAPHKDWRRGRGALQSIVPTTTGAAKALTRIFPHLSDKLGGCGMRVPVPDGSLTDITSIVKHPLNINSINELFQDAAQSRWSGILEYTEDPIVSSDIIGNSHSCVFDAGLTSVIGNMVKVVGWYDNEVGYSHRLCDVVLKCNTK